MTDTPDTFYVTTPIYYVNDRPHLGHVYTTMVADVVARYHRLRGDDTFFLTGVDEHAAKVSDKAAEKGLSPQEWADQNAAAFRETFEKLEMTNDDFVRTSSELHKKKVTEYVAALLQSGDVYEGEYEGWYDAGQEEYVPENKAKANDYKSEVNRKPLVRKKEKNYFFRLVKYVPELLALYDARDAANKPYVQPEARKNEIVNRIKDAKDVPISRTGSGGWGIPVPGDSEQTIYVWIDALFNYLTYVDTPDRKKYWQAGAVHFIAKDILWFHAAIWPALLIALSKCEGYGWVFEDKVRENQVVYSHSYWVSESGEKMSKSLGNFLDPAAIDNYVNEFGLDALRYFLATRGPLGVSDSAFSPDLFIEIYNGELANTFGNCFSRTCNMISRYCDGKAPAFHDGAPDDDPDITLSTYYRRYANEICEELDESIMSDVVTGLPNEVLAYVRHVDSFIEETQPFKLAKDPRNRSEVDNILYRCAEDLRIASVYLWPFIPDKVEEVWRRIGCDYAAQMQAAGGRGKLKEWTQWGKLEPGTPIEKGDALFPRYEVKKEQAAAK